MSWWGLLEAGGVAETHWFTGTHPPAGLTGLTATVWVGLPPRRTNNPGRLQQRRRRQRDYESFSLTHPLVRGDQAELLQELPKQGAVSLPKRVDGALQQRKHTHIHTRVRTSSDIPACTDTTATL